MPNLAIDRYSQAPHSHDPKCVCIWCIGRMLLGRNNATFFWEGGEMVVYRSKPFSLPSKISWSLNMARGWQAIKPRIVHLTHIILGFTRHIRRISDGMMEFVIRPSTNSHDCVPANNHLKSRNAGLSRFFDRPEARLAGRTGSQCESWRADDEKGGESVPEVLHRRSIPLPCDTVV